MRILALAMLLLPVVAAASSKIVVTAVEQRTGKAVTDLKADDFVVTDDKLVRRVEAVEPVAKLTDYLLLVDASLVGEMVRPVAAGLIAELREKEQMALIGYHSSADVIQELTASKNLLTQALARIRYGNTPLVLDALYAAIDGGFRGSDFRRVILLLTSGMEGPSRVSEREVLKMARRNGVSIYPIFATGSARGLCETLARQSGGASFSLRDMKLTKPAPVIFEAVRGAMTLTVQGNVSSGEKLKIELRRPGKYSVSAMPLE